MRSSFDDVCDAVEGVKEGAAMDLPVSEWVMLKEFVVDWFASELKCRIADCVCIKVKRFMRTCFVVMMTSRLAA
ncbi:hypothetical protein [Herminiimonas arsenitoxidans]|uniref:hypothetical protein n=1 Tax=Herminiimonas arsenitoxidans TaxID=1809410 RepID=UPI00097028D8|nr:hypothetical protein [Herminiimonas arsenitoxidans]